MRYLQTFDLPYLDIGKEDNLYEDVDLNENDIVEAQYWLENGNKGCPDICALPRAATTQEIQSQNNISVPGFTDKEKADMTLAEKKRHIATIKQLRFPFPFHSQIEQYLSMALISSYASRNTAVTTREIPCEVEGAQVMINILSAKQNISGNAMGFSILGTSGTGKSTAISLALSKYPRAILHRLGGYQYIQIPIIRLTAYSNNNLSALFLAFARQLDSILDAGLLHERALQGKASNLGKASAQICEWIRIYHIGAIVIDEIQFLDFGPASAKSFENLVTITAETGVALIVVGNMEASLKWSSNLRIQRRTESLTVMADSYCKDIDYMMLIIRKLWKYQLLSKTVALTTELANALYEESMGSIDLLTSLWMMVQFEAIKQKREPEITADYIRKISESRFKHMKMLLTEALIESEYRYRDAQDSIKKEILLSAQDDEQYAIRQKMKEASQKDIECHYDKAIACQQVVDAITCCYREYSESVIIKAFNRAEVKCESFRKMNQRERTQEVLSILKVRKGKKSQKTENRNIKSITSEGPEELEKKIDNLYDGLKGIM